MDRVQAAVLAVGPSERLERRVFALVSALLGAKAEEPELHSVLRHELSRVGAFPVITAMNLRSLSLTRALLEAHAGELPAVERELLAFMLVSSVEGVVSSALVEPPTRRGLGDPQLAQELTHLVMGYLERSRPA